ncbi:MAG: hypothetical protein H6608_05520 [Flavobacteriales bacterium]|nr:hypothetical protein [Bacteroidota bacterium]MCB9240565.1 hypothetical protein [Flavobacteriales bacterium]
MRTTRNMQFKGVGKALPELVRTNADIERDYGIRADWIYNRVGVRQRHIATHENNTSLAVDALKRALEDAGMEFGDLDCLISASVTFDYVLPNRSSLIKHAFTRNRDNEIPCVDINTVCTSFITALDYAACQIASGNFRNVAVVSSEIGSKGLNPKSPETFSLFGDGAAAVIVSTTENEEAGVRSYRMKTYSDGAYDTIIPGGGNVNHPKDHPYEQELYSFQMRGPRLLKLANSVLPNFMQELTAESDQPLNWVVPHQASRMGLKLLSGIKTVRNTPIVQTLENHGNCIAASVPLAFVTAVEDGRIQDGDHCLLIGTAAGMSVCGMNLTYATS